MNFIIMGQKKLRYFSFFKLKLFFPVDIKLIFDADTSIALL